METNLDILNPQSQEVVVGIKTLRKITLYPLSLGDQFDLKSLVIEALQGFFSATNQLDYQLVVIILDLFTKNLGKVMELATCGEEKGDAILKEVTNNQATAIAEVIYAMNYEDPIKNVRSLFNKVTGNEQQLPLERPSPTLSHDIQNTESKTSSEGTGKTEE
jgi:hypothetical protein